MLLSFDPVSAESHQQRVELSTGTPTFECCDGPPQIVHSLLSDHHMQIGSMQPLS